MESRASRRWPQAPRDLAGGTCVEEEAMGEDEGGDKGGSVVVEHGAEKAGATRGAGAGGGRSGGMRGWWVFDIGAKEARTVGCAAVRGTWDGRLMTAWREGVDIDGQVGRTYRTGPKHEPFNSVVAQPDIIKMGPVRARHERHAMLGPLSRPVVPVWSAMIIFYYFAISAYTFCNTY